MLCKRNILLSLLLLIFSVAALAYNSQNCDLTTYVRECWPGEFENYDIVTWNDVNSVANTGEDDQMLSGYKASTLKNYFTADEILEGYALGKVSQKRVCTIYCSEPEYFAGLQAVASAYPDYERLYTKAQGKAPSVTTSASTTTESTVQEEQITKKEKAPIAENNSSETKETQVDNTSAEESITGLFVVTVDTVALDAPKGNKIDTLAQGTEITVAGSSDGYYQLKYNKKTEYVLINNETIIPKDKYDKAWTETDKVEPTCTEDGYVTLTNSYSQIEKITSIAATGHDEGEWIVSKKAGFLTKGLEQRLCTKCDEVLEEREINAIINLPIAILVGVLAIITVTILTLLLKKKNER